MILLKANTELEMTFKKLIQTMEVNVKWNGIFAAIGDYLILPGEVRSLFFNFETRKAVTNIIELDTENGVREIEDNPAVSNVINMVLYAFGKWGSVKGIKVDKNYEQLNELFTGILEPLSIQPEFTKERFRFYKEGIRLAYEDVIQSALEAKNQSKPQENKEEKQGLWHKLIWKKNCFPFDKTDTTLVERQTDRLGNNFYMVGYLCPACKQHLHMVVFLEGKEFRIDSEEGGVLLARAYTCHHCMCFYTPRPKKLLAEGDIYEMNFDQDAKAYEDYMELLGEMGDRVSNYHFNEFEYGQKTDTIPETENEFRESEDVEEEQLQPEQEISDEELELLSDDEFFTLMHRIEEGFYPDSIVKAAENKLEKQKNIRRKKAADKSKKSNTSTEDLTIQPEQRYKEKLQAADRFSERQLKEFQRQLEKETNLEECVKQEYLKQIKEIEEKQHVERIRQKVNSCEKKSYAALSKVQEDVEKENLPKQEKKQLLIQLAEWKKEQGEREVRQLIEKMPKVMKRRQCREYMQKLQKYKDVDLAPYEKILTDRQKAAEQAELTGIQVRIEKSGKKELYELEKQLKSEDFSKEVSEPYLQKIRDRIWKLDEAALEKLCPDVMTITFEEGIEAYEAIEQGDFLPELKNNMLEMLKKRLTKIKTDECELLVRKLSE